MVTHQIGGLTPDPCLDKYQADIRQGHEEASQHYQIVNRTQSVSAVRDQFEY